MAVRLDSDEIRVAVTPGAAEAQPPQLPRPDDGDASARISLRLTEALKAEVDTAATAAGVSVNTWLVQAASAALGGKASNAAGHSGAREYRTSSSHHVTGWVTG